MRFPNRGGNYNNGASAGVFYMNLNNGRGNSNTNIGFCSALRLRRNWIYASQGSIYGAKGLKGFVSVCAKSQKRLINHEGRNVTHGTFI